MIVRWARELALGLRLAVTGGRGAQLRAGLTAAGVGLGVALLLVAASVPHILDAREERSSARQPVMVESDRDAPLRMVQTDTKFREVGISGTTLQQIGPDAPVPPGLSRLPGPGEMFVSPYLQKVLDERDEAGLLRKRLGARVAGTISPEGLLSPAEATYIRGSGALPKTERSSAVIGWGVRIIRDDLGPLFTLLVVVMIAALLLPIGIFIGAAVRFGGEDRDRRLAALRLAGADRSTTARVAAGETLLGAIGGLLVGGLLFVTLRPLVDELSVGGIAVYGDDIQPGRDLTLLVVVLVPLAAVLATLATLRGVAIEPLGVTRRVRPPQRRFLWRLLPTGLGLLLLWPFIGNAAALSDGGEYQAVAGVLLVLFGLTVLLPWFVEAIVRWAPAGPLPWQLAIRRLQLDGGTTGRVVGGIGVAVAGAIALQTIFSAAAEETTRVTGLDTARASMVVDARGGPATTPRIAELLSRTPGVERATTLMVGSGRTHNGDPSVAVGSCAALRTIVELRGCRDGDVFVVRAFDHVQVAPGARVRLGSGRDSAVFQVARDTPIIEPRHDIAYELVASLLLTPRAAAGLPFSDARSVSSVLLDPDDGDAADAVRTAIAGVDPLSQTRQLSSDFEPAQLTSLRRILFAGAFAVLLMIGAAMLVASIEQLRERRSVLAVLAAFGTRRRTLAWSVLCQTAIPVVVGLTLAIAIGTLLGGVLVEIAGTPMHIDWLATLGFVASGGAVVAFVTLLTMPVLWRLMRPDALRVE